MATVKKLEKYITTAEAGDMLGMTAAEVCQLCRSGKISARKFNRVWQVDRLVVKGMADLRRMRESRDRKLSDRLSFAQVNMIKVGIRRLGRPKTN